MVVARLAVQVSALMEFRYATAPRQFWRSQNGMHYDGRRAGCIIARRAQGGKLGGARLGVLLGCGAPGHAHGPLARAPRQFWRSQACAGADRVGLWLARSPSDRCSAPELLVSRSWQVLVRREGERWVLCQGTSR